MEIDLTIPFEKLQDGTNELKVIVICNGRKKILSYTITKEVPGDISRVRNYPEYAGGYNLGQLTLAGNTVSGDGVTEEYDNPISVTLPQNLVAIKIID